jgi:hypothetical protein
MRTAAAAAETTPEGSPSPTPQPPSSPPPPTGVQAPALGVRPTPSTSTASDAGPSPAYASDLPPDPLDGPASGSTPSASEPDDDSAPLKLRKKPLAEVIRGLVIGAGVVLNQRLTRSELEQGTGVWLMAEDEAAGMADPLASIANRRAGGAVVSGDMADVIQAGVAAAGYLIKNAIKAVQIRHALRRQPQGFDQQDPNDQGDQQ